MSSVFDSPEEPTAQKQRQDAAVKSTAALHAVFLSDPRAKELLALWEQAADRRVPINATIQEYAAAEAVRTFVATIKAQIAIAKQIL